MHCGRAQDRGYKPLLRCSLIGNLQEHVQRLLQTRPFRFRIEPARAELAALTRQESAMWGELIRERNIQVE